MALVISENSAVLSPSAEGKPGVQTPSPGKVLCHDDLTFPGPLMCNKIAKEDLIEFIQRKSEQCLLHADKPEQTESYFFWKMMELFCNRNGKVKMSQVSTVLFRSYRDLRNRMSKSVQKHSWCLQLAAQLCAVMQDNERVKAVIDRGDNFATKGLTFAAHLCYVAVYKESDFGLIGCESLPDEVSAMTEAMERTEVYEYVLGLKSECMWPKFQEFKVLYARKLFESGLSDQALNYCENFAKAVVTFPDRIPYTLLEQLVRLSEKLNEGKEKEPEWLLNLRLLHGKKADNSDSCSEQQQHAETPPPVGVVYRPECYLSRAGAFRAFRFFTEEFTSQYVVGEILGHGGGGAVFAGVRIADGKEVAIKFTIIDDYQQLMAIPGETSLVPSEVGLMWMVSKPVRSPYILELLEWLKIPGYMVLILERPSPCMDLQEFCERHGGKLPEPLARDIMFQLVQAVRHCFDCGVFYNDVKPGNILINTQTLQIKLIDFGSSEVYKNKPSMLCSGSMEYLPPEWCRYRMSLGRPTTVWTLGIVLFQILCGDMPFNSLKETREAQLHLPPGLSESCCKLISWCLEREPKSRPNFKQILKHRWMMGRSSFFQSFPVIGGLISCLLQFVDCYIN